MREIATTDGHATLHTDHDELDLWVDIHREATPKELAEVDTLANAEGLYVMYDECPAEHRGGGIVRYFLAYLEVTECL